MSTEKPVQLSRRQIDISDPIQVRFWLKHLGVSLEQLQSAVDKVGNSASAVRKELAARNSVEPPQAES